MLETQPQRGDALFVGGFFGLDSGRPPISNDAPEKVEVIQSRVSRPLQLCLADNSHSIYVAERPEGELVGYIAVHWLPYLFLPGPEGYISELFIRELARGQGLGSQLLEVVKKEAAERGCIRLSLINIRSRESY
jgi:GNAT superfamily N-acetyltransferase